MTAAVQNRMVKTAFECFIEFAQNASRILKSLSPFFHLFARTMGNVLRFIDDLFCCLFCGIGRVVNLLFGFVFHVTHGLSPSTIFNSGGLCLFSGNAGCPTAKIFSTRFQSIADSEGDLPYMVSSVGSSEIRKRSRRKAYQDPTRPNTSCVCFFTE